MKTPDEIVDEALNLFQKWHNCAESIDGIRKFREESVHEKICSHFVGVAMEVFMSLIKEP